ncbi:MAG: tRNA (adenosine(37)-N6)-threonylcarbamoyltransferase complex dimerization subunit type 1 TsaB [Alphaproteobacteria bacterium]|nr:tRNA (adenosine(37)-N6)-threonylcarbamoyltransferase complex dimerization subunit type 1 TsaB [Alphaproteobacteria bacterium]MDA8003727.1 tRNA (adenosine(37)-N6)-threonylcarbamoyltransferase complex dimerization subunit type 1 TsaB [Alphaproteobacteria bacterium]MDA8005150.1 tRNA (adenosine(37)-N6)-threonylcarbamoyltransferase complex dimerization subunit type 1 TsaB [Alphaproteobacteria bacterium]MDA8013048.1 tRNA (adenosine(37)-N6)-threonylcarbamoyltransferase complex dimerization subunit t
MTQPPVLAIETAGRLCQAALAAGDRILSRAEPGGRGQEGRLFTLIQDLLREAQISVDEIAGVAVARGPGGFTSLRAGLAAAHGLAIAKNIPLAAWSSFDLAAFAARQIFDSQGRNAGDDRPRLHVVLDSRRAGDPFVAHFNYDPNDILWGPAVSEKGDDNGDIIAAASGDKNGAAVPVFFFGDGVHELPNIPDNAQILHQPESPRGSSVHLLQLARALGFPENIPENARNTQALYIRPPQTSPPSSPKNA